MEVVFCNKVIFRGSYKKLLAILLFTCLSFKTFSQSDLCTGVVPTLTLGANAGATTAAFTTSGSDPSVGTGSGGCSTDNRCSYTGWYKYTTGAQGGNLTISMTVGSIKYGSMSMYSGSCGSFTQINCEDANSATATTPPPNITATCLAPNTTYYIMVWSDGLSTSNYYGTFTLTTTFTANNDCCNSAYVLSTGTTTGTNVGATTTGTDPTSACDNDGNYSYSVWYQYTTGAISGNLTVSLARGGIQYAELGIYSGTCGSFTELDCSDPNISAATPTVTAGCLAANTTYYIMVACDGAAASGYDGTYTLTTSFAASAAGNDCCSGATAITMNVTATIGSYTGTATGTNAAATADENSYCFTPNKNQWYTFVAPVTGSYYCGIVAGTIVDPEISVLTGSCGSFTEASCAGTKSGVTLDANHGATVALGTYTLPYAPFSEYSAGYTYGGICSVTAGTTVYVMVDNSPSGSAGTYTLTVANLKNDDIANPLIINNCGSVFQGTTIGATNCSNGIGNGFYNNVDNNTATACDGSTGVTSCGNLAGAPGSACYNGASQQTDANNNGGDIGYTIENDSWYVFCVVSNCTVTITFDVASASCLVPNGSVAALQLTAFTGTTGNLTKIYGGYCLESITTSASFSFAATANNCYYFEVDGYTGTNCNYSLQADITPTCVLPVKLLYFTGTNEQGKIKLDWTSEEEENSGKYVVERSDDGINYTPIITKKAIGNTAQQTNYIVYDDNPLINKINYYKLSEYDLNGKGGLLSQTFVSNTAGFAKFNVYPNPSSGKVNISIKNFSVPSITIEIIDVFGNVVWTSNNIGLTDGNSLQQVDLSIFEEGIYIVRTSDGTAFYNQRLMISK
jgi:type IX secretion system substrate protein